MYQLISITHMIYSSLNHTNSQVRGIFLDMSKAFDKIWHKGFLHKIGTFGISNNVFYILQSFLSNRFQRVSLNGLTSIVKLFADDFSVFSVVDNSPLHSANMLNNDLAMINNWAYKWRMSFNLDPTKQATVFRSTIFTKKKTCCPSWFNFKRI